MTFPGTYNINYYYGDTFEFRVYPKNTNGSAFILDTFDEAKFTLAPTRGADLNDQIPCYAVIDSNSTNILCAISPNDALQLDPTKQYVYDVEIKKAANPYDIVYTLLTGNVNITQDVTLPTTSSAEEIPDNPTNLVTGTVTDSTISVSWTAPTTGGNVSNYKLAVIPYSENSETLESAISNATTTISSSNTSYTFVGLDENTNYSVLILSTNATGDASYSSVLTNELPITTEDDPNTQEPDFIVTNDGSASYVIDGESNPSITVMRGQTYLFELNASGHPFWIQTTRVSGYDATAEYSSGVSGNGTDVGQMLWTVPLDAPDTLFYQCQFHASMGGNIIVIEGSS